MSSCKKIYKVPEEVISKFRATVEALKQELEYYQKFDSVLKDIEELEALHKSRHSNHNNNYYALTIEIKQGYDRSFNRSGCQQKIHDAKEALEKASKDLNDALYKLMEKNEIELVPAE